jgi:hypothetical protein
MLLMKVRTFLLVALGISSAARSQVRIKVVDDVDDGRCVYRLAAVDGGVFSFESARSIARQFTQEFSGKRRILAMFVGSSVAVSRATRHGQVDGNAREVAFWNIKHLGLPQGPVARVWGIDGAVSLAYRSGDAFREEIIEGGRDPLVFTANGVNFRLLHLRLMTAGPAVTKQPDYSLEVFARSPLPISAAAVITLTKAISHLTNASSVEVAVRPDDWFMSDPDFPDILPFQDTMGLPEKNRDLLAPALSCSSLNSKVLCGGTSFAP